MIICAGRNESFSFATSIGVGLIESTINLTRICLFDRPDYILFIGSAGSYGEYNILDIVQSRSASNIELSFLNNDSYTLLDNVLRSENKMTENETIVNSSNYVSTNETLVKKFKKYGIGIENMEFFALMNVAKEFDIDIAGIFVITNYANKKAHQDFKDNHQEALSRLTHFLEKKKIIVPHET
jgi:nucleoside phosphorylase